VAGSSQGADKQHLFVPRAGWCSFGLQGYASARPHTDSESSWVRFHPALVKLPQVACGVPGSALSVLGWVVL
jgi:hypothetical protein